MGSTIRFMRKSPIAKFFLLFPLARGAAKKPAKTTGRAIMIGNRLISSGVHCQK
jgi:hypothetical protein